jgi:hypothetical protein
MLQAEAIYWWKCKVFIQDLGRALAVAAGCCGLFCFFLLGVLNAEEAERSRERRGILSREKEGW